MKCETCIYGRYVTSENGKHPVCCRSEEDAKKCTTGEDVKYIQHPLSGTMRNDTNSTGRVLLYRSSTFGNCKPCFGILTFHRRIEKPGVRSINRKGGNLLIKCNSTKNERPDFLEGGMKMEYSLKSCPFCGSEGVDLVHLWDKFGNIEGGRICCSGCGGTYADATASCDEDLIQSWNSRIPMNDWISVESDYPEEGVRVLVSTCTKKDVRSVNLAYYSNGFWHGQGSMSGVQAWMPLPAEYDKEVDDERYE